MRNVLFSLAVFLLFIHTSGSQTFTNISSQSGINAVYRDSVYIPGGGVAFGDYNNDGYPDMVIASYNRFKVYKNNGDGTFTNATASSGINFTGLSLKSAVFGDYNNDGWRDIYLTSWYSQNRLYKNNGDGSFTDVTAVAGVGVPFTYQSTCAAWGDYNKDGLLDLYVGNYGNIEGMGDQPNILFKNNGNGTFTDVTSLAGVADSIGKKPLGITIFDYDLDGWQDIYINMDKEQRSTMFHNNGNGTFTDVSVASGTNCHLDAMGTSIADYNHDGLLDIYVSNGPPGNILYKNNGNGTFTDVTLQTGTSVNKECWGNNFIDYNNDGWLDIFATAAHGIDRCDVLLRNNGGVNFTNLGFNIGVKDSAFSFGTAKADINNDGYPDFCVTVTDSNAHFYKNSGGTNNWIKLKCRGVISNRDAIGTIVTAYYNGVLNRQVILGGNSYLSEDDVVLIFGLGTASAADSLTIKWTNGMVERATNLNANALYHAVEGSGIIGIKPISTEIPKSFSLSQNYPNPFNPSTTIKFSVPEAGNVSIKLFDITGRDVSVLVDEFVKPGIYSVNFNASGLASGVYFYRLTAGNYSEVRKMILLK
jgi:FG-GAP-like repeat/ASPIC and UnbV/Secretion system C-terminal sorting domain/FG-GAP repeat